MPASLLDSSIALPSAVSSTKAWWLLFSLLAGLLVVGRVLQPTAAPKALVKSHLGAPAARTVPVHRLVGNTNAELAPAATL